MSSPIPSRKESSSNKQIRGSKLLKHIPSATKTSEQLEIERKLSLISRERKTELNEKYGTHKGTTSTDPGFGNILIEGRATVRPYSELGTYQLCCEYSNDYTLFATGGTDGTVRIFDAASGDLVAQLLGGREIEGQTSCVTCIKYKQVQRSDKAQNCFTCSYVNGIVKCFNYITTECLFTIKERRQTYGLAHHPRMDKFLTYGDDLKINLYDIETQNKQRIFQSSMYREAHDGPASRVFAARFNPCSNSEFLSGGWDDTVLHWDLRVPHAARYIKGVYICGEGLDINKNGKQILTCSWRKEDPLQLWDYSTFKLLKNINPDRYRSKLYCGRFLTLDSFACGGGDPSILRLVDMLMMKSRIVITGLPSDVCHLCAGMPKVGMARKKNLVKLEPDAFDDEGDNIACNLDTVPKVLFTSGSKVNEACFSTMKSSDEQ